MAVLNINGPTMPTYSMQHNGSNHGATSQISATMSRWCSIIYLPFLSKARSKSIDHSKSTGKEYSTQEGYFYALLLCCKTVIGYIYLLMNILNIYFPCDDTTPLGLMLSQ